LPGSCLLARVFVPNGSVIFFPFPSRRGLTLFPAFFLVISEHSRRFGVFFPGVCFQCAPRPFPFGGVSLEVVFVSFLRSLVFSRVSGCRGSREIPLRTSSPFLSRVSSKFAWFLFFGPSHVDRLMWGRFSPRPECIRVPLFLSFFPRFLFFDVISRGCILYFGCLLGLLFFCRQAILSHPFSFLRTPSFF